MRRITPAQIERIAPRDRLRDRIDGRGGHDTVELQIQTAAAGQHDIDVRRIGAVTDATTHAFCQCALCFFDHRGIETAAGERARDVAAGADRHLRADAARGCTVNADEGDQRAAFAARAASGQQIERSCHGSTEDGTIEPAITSMCAGSR